MADSLGKLTVEIDADKDRLDTATKQAKSELQGVGDEGEKAGIKINDGMGRAGKSIQNATQGARDFVGSLTETIGIATGVVGIIAALTGGVIALGKAIGSLTSDSEDESIKTFRKDLQAISQDAQGFDKASKRFAPGFDLLQDKIKETRKEIGILSGAADALGDEFEVGFFDAVSSFDANIFQGLTGELDPVRRKALEKEKERLDTLLSQRNAFLKKTKDAEEKAAKEEAEARADAFRDTLRERADSIRISMLPPIEQVRENAEKQKMVLIEQAEEAGVELNDKQLELALARIEEQKKAQIKSIRDTQEAQEQADKQAEKNRLEQIRERERAERESAERAARSAREAFQRELSGLANNLFDTAGQNLTSRLDTIVDELRNVTQSVGRR